MLIEWLGSIVAGIRHVSALDHPWIRCVRYHGQTVLRYIHMKSGHYSIPRALTPSL